MCYLYVVEWLSYLLARTSSRPKFLTHMGISQVVAGYSLTLGKRKNQNTAIPFHVLFFSHPIIVFTSFQSPRGGAPGALQQSRP